MKSRLNRSRKNISHLSNLLSKKNLYILGLNSGTSGDGLDVALVKFQKGLPGIVKAKTYPYPTSLKNKILNYSESEFDSGSEWLKLDYELGLAMANYTNRFIPGLSKSRLKVDLIASHGQTIRHIPSHKSSSLTYQIGDPSQIAQKTGIPVIYDFRKADLAAGGQGAPMSPMLHQHLFRSKTEWTAIVNIGGIANITVLPPTNSTKKPFASDTGPGNMTIDAAMNHLYGKPFDKNGAVALKGYFDSNVVKRILAMSYFKMLPPKSTGREMFGRKFRERIFNLMPDTDRQDIVATVSEITVRSITSFMNNFTPKTSKVYVCGGGAHNKYILKRISELMPGSTVRSTEDLGYSPDYLEALLWAYLANLFINGISVDASKFTGARKPYIPGRLCLC